MLVLMETEDMLADLGCSAVVAAATNEQAIALIETRNFDAALLDLNLNGVRSYPVADLLAARGIPFAFATSYGGHGLRDGDRERSLLVKPLDVIDWKSCLRICCRLPSNAKFERAEALSTSIAVCVPRLNSDQRSLI